MTIKDVEKLTGLTAKSIRFYEEKGLVTVERNEENSYRSYSETEVIQLKKIKLFRYLDFSIEEIGELLKMDAEKVENALRKKAEEFSEQRDKCAEKQDLCLTLAKDYRKNEEVPDGIIEEYNQVIEDIESEEMAEIKDELMDIGTPSLSMNLLYTLMFSGPILWLFINISEGKVESLMLNAVLAIVMTVLITANWAYYIYWRMRHKERVQKKNRGTLWIFPLLIVSIIVGIMAFGGVLELTEALLTPNDYYFMEYHPIAQMVMIVLVMLAILLMGALLFAKLTKKNDILGLWNEFGKFVPLLVIAWLIGMYCCVTSVTVVTEDTIICHSPIHPAGVEYSYSDVAHIVTGFEKGDFFYKIELGGKTITFKQATWNETIEKYNEDTYLYIEEFDQRLVELGIPKQGDSRGYENCSYDKHYVDRFVRITELR